jgi:hypothetical protein
MRPVKSRFGSRPPTVEQAVEAVAQQRGEVIVSMAPPRQMPWA